MSKVNWNDIANTFDRKYYFITEEGEVVKRSWGERIVRTLHLESFVNNVVARIFPSLRFENHHSIPSEKFRRNIQVAANLEPNKVLVAMGLAKINNLIDHISEVSLEELDPVTIADEEEGSSEEPSVGQSLSPVQSDEEEESSSAEVNSRDATPPLPVDDEEAPVTPPHVVVTTHAANFTTPSDTTAPVVDFTTPENVDWEGEYRLLSDGEDATKTDPQLVNSFILDETPALPQTFEEVELDVDNLEEPVAKTAQVRDSRIVARDAEKANPGTKLRAHVSVEVEDVSE